jgi:Metallo-peptidase family M12B Reprolysin-like
VFVRGPGAILIASVVGDRGRASEHRVGVGVLPPSYQRPRGVDERISIRFRRLSLSPRADTPFPWEERARLSREPVDMTKHFAWVFVIFGALSVASDSCADSPYRASVFLPSSIEVREISSPNGLGVKSVAPSRRRIHPIELRAKVRGVGWIVAEFDRHVPRGWKAMIGNAPDRSEVLLLEGSIRVGHAAAFAGENSQPASASLINGRLRITFRGPNRNGRARHFTLSGRPIGRRMEANVASVPGRVLGGKSCGTGDRRLGAGAAGDHGHDRGAGSQEVSTNAVREIEVATDFDPLWYGAMGATTNSEIAARVVAASVIYERDLGLVMKIVAQNGYTSGSPYSSTDSSRLLNQFTANAERYSLRNRSDVQLLFTGIEMEDGVAGIAWTGVICQQDGEYSYGVVGNISAQLDHLVLAHEVGHSLDADHSSSGIMTAVLNPSATGFAAGSVSTITGYVASMGSCLAETSGTAPAPDPTAGPGPEPAPPAGETPTIFIERSGTSKVIAKRDRRGRTTFFQRVKVQGWVYNSASEDETGYAGVSVAMLVGAQQKSVLVSGEDGFFSARLDLPASKKSVVKVSGVVNEQSIDSNLLTVKKLR